MRQSSRGTITNAKVKHLLRADKPLKRSLTGKEQTKGDIVGFADGNLHFHYRLISEILMSIMESSDIDKYLGKSKSKDT
jgi:hypothetical protein